MKLVLEIRWCFRITKSEPPSNFWRKLYRKTGRGEISIHENSLGELIKYCETYPELLAIVANFIQTAREVSLSAQLYFKNL